MRKPSQSEIDRVKKENILTFRMAGIPMSKKNLSKQDVAKLNAALRMIRSKRFQK